MGHLKMPKRTKERLGRRTDDPELAMLRAPCRGCNKTVSLAPTSTKERFGVRCLFCLSPYCVPCGTKHFERKKTPKLKRVGKGWWGSRRGLGKLGSSRKCVVDVDRRLKKIEQQLAQALKRTAKR